METLLTILLPLSFIVGSVLVDLYFTEPIVALKDEIYLCEFNLALMLQISFKSHRSFVCAFLDISHVIFINSGVHYPQAKFNMQIFSNSVLFAVYVGMV